MASQLEDKVQYGLLSSGFSGADKTILQFKLTDSSLKSIEEYLSAKANCNKRPRIHFKGNLGVITVPWYDEVSKKTRKHEYKFTVQPIQAPEKSSLECIQQFRNKRGSEQLDSIGAIQTKISIHANDDTYKKTQERMKQADENLKRVSTQEVKQENLNPGKKVKINSQTSYAIKAISASSTRSTPPAAPSVPSRTSSVISSSSQVSKPRAIPPSKSSAKPSPTFPSTFKPTQPKLSSSNSNTSRKSTVYNKPCRERIIHLLALKPYKRPEIMLRLKSDGISEKERNKISATLQEVATMTKDNSYILHKSLYSQVREDWPQYTDEDRKNLKRRIEQLRTKESPVRSQPSPSPARVDIDTSTAKRKRIILPEVTDYTAPKKSRIAHNRSHQTQEGKNSPSDSHSQPPTPQGATYKPPTPQGATYKPPTPQGGNKPPTPQGGSGSYHPSVSSPSISTTKCSPDSSYSSDPTPAAKAIPKNAREIREEEEERYSSHMAGKENSHHHNHHHHHHKENQSPAGQVSSSAPDYIMEFPPVTSKEQRSRYKEKFYKEYPEYERLCKDIMRVTELFTDLKDRLAKAEVGSEKHDQIKEEIIAENKNVQKRNNFKSMNIRFKYLHEKLAHVKQMIANYDEGSCS